ncbi:hypothetical protein BU23DRAFT_569460 [Bimuria novae-zelandiae CBS 107.79]|uniref:Uncharacterized protein n=1 Tax=Bimuria novae-zelandiae CBS 107.79 TaxID=1447943 RepID=A0A6A5VFE2_9PLEO|nr:hypothetical protein BU23DRAFT_569460 [Bimuria novae-zelandiae CBS 107.79]
MTFDRAGAAKSLIPRLKGAPVFGARDDPPRPNAPVRLCTVALHDSKSDVWSMRPSRNLPSSAFSSRASLNLNPRMAQVRPRKAASVHRPRTAAASHMPALTHSGHSSYMNQMSARCTSRYTASPVNICTASPIGRMFRNCICRIRDRVRQAGEVQANDLRCTK